MINFMRIYECVCAAPVCICVAQEPDRDSELLSGRRIFIVGLLFVLFVFDVINDILLIEVSSQFLWSFAIHIDQNMAFMLCSTRKFH